MAEAKIKRAIKRNISARGGGKTSYRRHQHKNRKTAKKNKR